jgi:2-(3-amino-3-carboxypropyl)histidine synthase
MDVMDYSLDITDLATTIREKGWKRIGFQFPEGVKPHAGMILSNLLDKLKVLQPDVVTEYYEFVQSGSSCYGACDLADHELLMAGVDGMVHFGHSEIPNITGNRFIPVIHQEMRSKTELLPVVKQALEKDLLSDTVGLTTTVQHIHLLEGVRSFLESKGIEVRIGTGTDRLAYPGQVLGCSFSSATAVPEADMHLFIGEGEFHAIGVSMATRKKVIACDPCTGEIRDMDVEKDRILRQRFAAIQKLKDSNDIAVILSTLPGQKRQMLAASLLKKGSDHGKNMVLITAPHLNLQSLVNLGARVIVSTACPRVAIDDYEMYLEHAITITTPIEFLISIGEMEWDEYVLDTIE